MKKIVVLCLALVMILSLNLAVFAAPNNFVSSPTGSQAPGVVEFTPSNDEFTGDLVITSFAGKDELSATLKALLEKAYDTIISTDDLTKLNADLAKIAADLKIDGKYLAVSELFDIHVTGYDPLDGHYSFDIVLSADSLKNFVGLLHMNKDGKWELISNAKVIANGDHLKFTVESLSPFAIVVDTTEGSSEVDTGDYSMVWLWVILAAASGLAIVAFSLRKKA